MQEVSFDEAIELIRARNPRYQADAYHFVREALDFTQKRISKDNRGRVRHVTGQELLGGVRDFALERFGPMAMLVLEEWGIHHCQDFGEIVFDLVEAQVLAKTETDSRADFEQGYDFYEAFRKPFLPPSKQQNAEPESAASSSN